MDLSNIQPIQKRFDNEAEAEKYLSKLSTYGQKKVDVISIYRGGSYVYAWFYYDRAMLNRLSGVKEAEAKPAKKATKKVTKKKPTKRKAKLDDR